MSRTKHTEKVKKQRQRSRWTPNKHEQYRAKSRARMARVRAVPSGLQLQDMIDKALKTVLKRVSGPHTRSSPPNNPENTMLVHDIIKDIVNDAIDKCFPVAKCSRPKMCRLSGISTFASYKRRLEHLF